MQFEATPRVIFSDPRLGVLQKASRLCIFLGAFYLIVVQNDHLMDTTGSASSVYLAVSDLTDIEFNATPASESCEDFMRRGGLRKPWNGAPKFTEMINVRLRAMNGQGYTRQSGARLTVNTVVEENEWLEGPCGLLGGKTDYTACPKITEPTPYATMFGEARTRTSYARCVLDWDRYVVMLNASLFTAEGLRWPIHRWYLQDASGRQPLEESENATWYDWLLEALPAVRSGRAFRSRYHGLIYIPVTKLINMTAEAANFHAARGTSANLNIFFTNAGRWTMFGWDQADVIISVDGERFWPFMYTERLRSSWHRGGIQIHAQVTSDIKAWSASQFAITLVSYYNYSHVGGFVILMVLLYGDYPVLRYLFGCMSFLTHVGRSRGHRGRRHTSHWFRSQLRRYAPDIRSRRYVFVEVDINSDEDVGLTVDPTSFRVTAIAPNSAVSLANAGEELEQRVSVGDVLTQVNSFTRDTPVRAMKELNSSSSRTLDMTFLRMRDFREVTHENDRTSDLRMRDIRLHSLVE